MQADGSLRSEQGDGAKMASLIHAESSRNDSVSSRSGCIKCKCTKSLMITNWMEVLNADADE